MAEQNKDEFIIFLESKLTIEDLQNRCQAILNSLAIKDSCVPVTLSIGGYLFNQQTDYKDLYQSADKIYTRLKEMDAMVSFLKKVNR